MKLSTEDGQVKVIKEENGLEKEEVSEIEKGYQKQLTPIYNN